MTMIDEIQKALGKYYGNWNEKKGVWDFSATIAERKAFLSTKKLIYTAKMRIDEGAKIVRFFEMLIEAGSGFSSGGGYDDGMSAGFGFKTESYNTFKGAREGNIEEQSSFFGKDYSYTFDFREARTKVKEAVERAGYTFEYQILPVK